MSWASPQYFVTGFSWGGKLFASLSFRWKKGKIASCAETTSGPPSPAAPEYSKFSRGLLLGQRVGTTEMDSPGESLRRRQTVGLEWVRIPTCLPVTAIVFHPPAALPHGKCSRSLDQNPERKMCSPQCTHLISLGAQLPNVSLNLLPKAEHSLELCQQEIVLIVWDTHCASLCSSLSPGMV